MKKNLLLISIFIVFLSIGIIMMTGCNKFKRNNPYDPYNIEAPSDNINDSNEGGVGYEGSYGEVTFFAGGFNFPRKIVINATGDYLYVTDSHRIQQILISTKSVNVIAGDLNSGNTDYVDGTSCRFNFPAGIDYNNDSNILLVCDEANNKIRKTENSGTYYTYLLSGGGTYGYTGGDSMSCMYRSPIGIVYKEPNVYITDKNNHMIRRIDYWAGTAYDFCGFPAISGTADGWTFDARFNGPEDIVYDAASDYFYVADTENHTIRRISSGAEVVTIAGQAGVAGSADGESGFSKLNKPKGIALVDGLFLYVADTGNHTIRRIDISLTGNYKVETMAGKAGESGDIDGTWKNARFYSPEGITVNGNVLYVADTFNNSIKKVVIK